MFARKSARILGGAYRQPSTGYKSVSTRSAFRVHEEVQQALSEGRPVVALETAVYTHGFPYPDNIELASRLANTVRENGAVPATIGVLDGVARVGFDADDLERLAGSTGQPTTIKVSRRDVAFACGSGPPGRRYNGGTTIAGTMLLAHMAGINVFATGGLGGVHRGGEVTMDVSADLTELGRTPVAVISSGCKSFLDLPRTLEYLETEGVAVAAFADGRDGKVDFPGFWSRDSGVKSPMTLQNEAEAAAIIHTQLSFGIRSGMFFANPIPASISIAKSEMDQVIHQAVTDAEKAGVFGNANTPFVLNRIKDITGSRSVEANRGLLVANAQRGARVAVELAKLRQGGSSQDSHLSVGRSSVMNGPGAVNFTHTGLSKGTPSPIVTANHDQTPAARATPESLANLVSPLVFVAGSIAVDFSCDYRPGSSASPKQPMLQTSNPAAISQSIGGVGQNVARAVHLLKVPVRLCTMLGDDLASQVAKLGLESIDMDQTGVVSRTKSRTAQYVAVNAADKGLVVAMADMEILEQEQRVGSKGPAQIFHDTWQPQLQEHRPQHLVIDANWSSDMLYKWLEAAKSLSCSTLFEPVSTFKATRIFATPEGKELGVWPDHHIGVSTPNIHELSTMYAAARDAGFFEREDWWKAIDALGIPSSGARTQLALATSPELVDAGVPQQSIQLLPFMPVILTKLGADGVLLTQIIPPEDPRLASGKYAPYIISRCDNGSKETSKVGGLYMRLFPAAEKVPEEEIVSVNGVGDTFLGAVVAGMVRSPDKDIEELVLPAQQAAVLTLRSKESVSPRLADMRLGAL